MRWIVAADASSLYFWNRDATVSRGQMEWKLVRDMIVSVVGANDPDSSPEILATAFVHGPSANINLVRTLHRNGFVPNVSHGLSQNASSCAMPVAVHLMKAAFSEGEKRFLLVAAGVDYGPLLRELNGNDRRAYVLTYRGADAQLAPAATMYYAEDIMRRLR